MTPPGHFVASQRIGMGPELGIGGWQLDGGVLDDHE
jgi:hypothetical protein